MAIKIGTKAPNIKLQSTSGSIFDLSVDKKDKPIIIYFYPKDFTNGCTAEACQFRDMFSYFKGIDMEVIGISRDSVETHLKFKSQYQLPFELLADFDGKTAQAYGALIPIVKLTRRVTYLLDKQHRIVGVYEDMFGATNHIDEMIKKIKINENLL